MTEYIEYLKILEQTKVGGIVALLVLILIGIELCPFIHLSPLEWIGKRVNKEVSTELKSLKIEIEDVKGNLNEHIVGSFRSQLLDFADAVIAGQVFTHDKWRAMLRMASDYEDMIEKHNLINGDATEAIEYIRDEYHVVCQSANFVTLPVVLHK